MGTFCDDRILKFIFTCWNYKRILITYSSSNRLRSDTFHSLNPQRGVKIFIRIIFNENSTLIHSSGLLIYLDESNQGADGNFGH